MNGPHLPGRRICRAGLALLLGCVAVLPVLTSGCRSKGGDTIVVGVVLPISGREGKPGQYQKEGVELAIKQINDKGGLTLGDKKYQIKEVFYDDGSDSAKSAAWITAGAAATSIFSQGRQYVFGTLSPIAVLGSTTAEFLGSLVDQGKLKKGLKLALAVENTDHGIDYVNGIQDWIQKHPGYFTVVFNEKFELGGSDFSGLLQKVKAAKADIFLSDAHLQDYILMQRQYLQAGMHHQMISYGARGPELDARKALGDGINYIFAGVWWSDKLPYPQVKQFISDYKQVIGRNPDSWYAATAYDSMRILAQSMQEAGSADKTKIRDALRNAQLKDSLLPGQVLKYGSNGQAGYPFVIVQNMPGGKVEIIYPKDAATAPAIAPSP